MARPWRILARSTGVEGVLCIDIPRSANAVSEKPKERWQELCEQASIEADPEKLLELVTEINRLLEAKHRDGVAESPEPDVDNELRASDGQRGPASVRSAQSQLTSRKKNSGSAA